MRCDVEAGALLELLGETLHPAVVEVDHRPTARADHMMPVTGTKRIAMALVEAVNPLEQVQVAEQSVAPRR